MSIFTAKTTSFSGWCCDSVYAWFFQTKSYFGNGDKDSWGTCPFYIGSIHDNHCVIWFLNVYMGAQHRCTCDQFSQFKLGPWTMGMFELHDITWTTMATQVKDLLCLYNLLDKVMAYIKDEGGNLTILIRKFSSIITCAQLVLPILAKEHVLLIYF